MTFLERLESRARALGRTVAFPEARDPRVIDAAVSLARRKIVTPLLVGDPDAADRGLARLGARNEVAVEPLAAISGRPAPALESAIALLREGRVDAVVAGAEHTTAQVVRAGLRGIGLRAGARTLSSSFLIEVADFRGRGAEVLTFADPAVVPSPGPVRLADIAREAVRTHSLVAGGEPRVAFLSYSTLGSADGRSVEKVREGLRLFRKACPDVAADGELQADAALMPDVARKKAPGSPVAGNASVLVFPDLDAANIAYKLVERLAGATALGPVLQGLAAPLMDLSRGASAEDIVHVAAVASLMADAT